MLSDLDKGDAATLAASLRDVVALSTLPALWSGAEPDRIAESLAAALCTTLGAKFVYVAVSGGEGVPTVSVAQTDRYETSPSLAADIGPRLVEWARTRDPDELLVLPNPFGEGVMHVTTRPLGHHAELGVIAAGFASAPTPAHHLLLNVGATQAATGVKNALLFGSLRRSEGRFRALVDASTQIVWTVAMNGSIREDSPSWREFTGQSYQQWMLGRWTEAVHPEDRERVVRLWRKAVEQGSAVATEFRLRHVSGAWHHAAVRAVPRIDHRGSVQEWVGMIVDVTARKNAEDAQQLLIGELNHRVKNTLAVVQAIAFKTSRHAKNPSEFVTSFNGRLHSLARVHTQLSEANWQGTDFHALIRDQLLQDADHQNNLTISGPRIALDPQVATHLGMVLHELGTNSRKYGAFLSPKGNVTVQWTIAGRLLQLVWIERGGPAVVAPINPGFGTTVITRNAEAYAGKAQMHCTSEGVTWEITWTLPETSVSQIAQNAALFPGAADKGISDPVPTDKASPTLSGKRILVVEDEVMVGLNMTLILEGADAVAIGPCSSIEGALKVIETEQLDAALLDANIRGLPVDEAASALTRRNIPFAFVTGYGSDSLPLAFRSAPIIAKPFTSELLLDQTVNLVSRARPRLVPLTARARPHNDTLPRKKPGWSEA